MIRPTAPHPPLRDPPFLEERVQGGGGGGGNHDVHLSGERSPAGGLHTFGGRETRNSAGLEYAHEFFIERND